MDTTTNPLSHPPASQNDIEKQKKGKTVNLKRKSGKDLMRSRAFDRLPVDLLRIVLEYYAKTFQGIIAFSCLSKTCKEGADYSSLWRTLKLHFYCPRKYLVETGENIQEKESAEQYAERIISGYYGGGRIYNKELFCPKNDFDPFSKFKSSSCYVMLLFLLCIKWK
jgi:hypothetical protein